MSTSYPQRYVKPENERSYLRWTARPCVHRALISLHHHNCMCHNSINVGDDAVIKSWYVDRVQANKFQAKNMKKRELLKVNTIVSAQLSGNMRHACVQTHHHTFPLNLISMQCVSFSFFIKIQLAFLNYANYCVNQTRKHIQNEKQ